MAHRPRRLREFISPVMERMKGWAPMAPIATTIPPFWYPLSPRRPSRKARIKLFGVNICRNLEEKALVFEDLLVFYQKAGLQILTVN